jgi:hypothetical protein
MKANISGMQGAVTHKQLSARIETERTRAKVTDADNRLTGQAKSEPAVDADGVPKPTDAQNETEALLTDAQTLFDNAGARTGQQKVRYHNVVIDVEGTARGAGRFRIEGQYGPETADDDAARGEHPVSNPSVTGQAGEDVVTESLPAGGFGARGIGTASDRNPGRIG